MNNWNWNLDELVDKVMADLRNGDVKLSESNVSAALTRDFRLVHSRKNEKSESHELSGIGSSNTALAEDKKLRDDVFTLKECVVFSEIVCKYALQTSIKRWKLRPGTVVTPSAKDELKKRGIELVCENGVAKSYAGSSRIDLNDRGGGKSRVTFSASNIVNNNWLTSKETLQDRSKKTQVFLAVHLPDNEKFPSNVYDYLTRNASLTETSFACLKEVSRQIQNELEKDKSLKVVLTTHDGAVASVWCNRLSGIRAITAFSYDQVCCDIEATNANVVIVDPARVGSYQFRRIVDYYLRLETK